MVNPLIPGSNRKVKHTQAFIQALLSTAIFHQRFSFFTVCLVQLFHGVAPWWTPKDKFLEFRSTDHCKMHFPWILLRALESYQES